MTVLISPKKTRLYRFVWSANSFSIFISFVFSHLIKSEWIIEGKFINSWIALNNSPFTVVNCHLTSGHLWRYLLPSWTRNMDSDIYCRCLGFNEVNFRFIVSVMGLESSSWKKSEVEIEVMHAMLPDFLRWNGEKSFFKEFLVFLKQFFENYSLTDLQKKL